jgi:23S rRNA (uracil1939-C5)-methyltransferase
VALTLPGEKVLATRAGSRARLDEIVTPSPDRVSPPCPHFGACGGCSLQHWHADPAGNWKAGLLGQALQRAGFHNIPLRPLARTPPGTRRRIDLAFQRDGAGFKLGLHTRLSQGITDLGTCLVLNPVLVALLDPLRRLLPRLRAVRRSGSALLNLLEDGPDLLLRTDAPLTTNDRTLLADFARTEGLCRISHAQGTGIAETACLLRPPSLTLSGAKITPPPAAFLQATPEGEAAIIGAVMAGLQNLPAKARIAELFAGCGTLSFALAALCRVTAWEGDAAAIAALRSAHVTRIEAIQRDLSRQPLRAKELSGFAAVVLDPPWQGAAEQMPELVAARPKRVIYVSCNPATLGRDAAALFKAGYEVMAATPIDQFVWSARLESVVVFALT